MNYIAASINQSPVITMQAGADLADVRGKAVMFDETGGIVLADAGKSALGIAVLSNPENINKGDDIDIQIKDIGHVKVGAAVKPGDALAPDANGALVPATSGSYIAIALESGAKDAFVQAVLRSGSLAAASGGATPATPGS